MHRQQLPQPDEYLKNKWEYVITVCAGSNESCPTFLGNVKHRLHIGFDGPTHATETPEFIESEYYRIRDEIKKEFWKFYKENLKIN